MKKITTLLLILCCLYKVNAQKILRIEPIIIDDTLTGYCMLSLQDRISEEEKSYKFLFYNTDLKEVNTVDFTTSALSEIKSFKFNGEVLCVLTRYQEVKMTPIGKELPPINLTFNFIKKNGEKQQLVEEHSGLSESLRSTVQLWDAITPINKKGFLFTLRSNSKVYGKITAFNNSSELLWSKDSSSCVKTFDSKILLCEQLTNEPAVYEQYTPTLLKLVDFEKPDSFLFSHKLIHTDSSYFYPIDLIQNKGNYYLIKAEIPWVKYRKYIGPQFLVNPKFYSLLTFNEKAELISEKSINGGFNETYSTKTVRLSKSFDIPIEHLRIKRIYFIDDFIYVAGEKNLETKKVEQEVWTYGNFKREYKLYKLDFNLNIIETKSVLSAFEHVKYLGYLSEYYGKIFFYSGSAAIADYNYHSGISSIYHVLDKKEKKKITFETIGLINNEFYSSSLDFNLLSDYYEIFPAKPGYVCIFEYFEKEKKIDFRLEKFDF